MSWVHQFDVMGRCPETYQAEQSCFEFVKRLGAQFVKDRVLAQVYRVKNHNFVTIHDQVVVVLRVGHSWIVSELLLVLFHFVKTTCLEELHLLKEVMALVADLL